MTKSQHTPWRADFSTKLDCWAVFDSRGACIVTAHDEGLCRLIAAAPQLLEACNGLLGLLTLLCNRDDISVAIKKNIYQSHRYEEAIFAVAKAEGK